MSGIPLHIDCLEESLGNLRSLLADPRLKPQLDNDALYALLAEKGLAEEERSLDEWREMGGGLGDGVEARPGRRGALVAPGAGQSPGAGEGSARGGGGGRHSLARGVPRQGNRRRRLRPSRERRGQPFRLEPLRPGGG